MGHDKNLAIILQNGGSPSADKGPLVTGGGGLASAFKPCLRLRQGPSAPPWSWRGCGSGRVTYGGCRFRTYRWYPSPAGEPSPNDPPPPPNYAPGPKPDLSGTTTWYPEEIFS